ncbi:5917_t:CDS:2, partial [Racocetra persica]
DKSLTYKGMLHKNLTFVNLLTLKIVEGVQSANGSESKDCNKYITEPLGLYITDPLGKNGTYYNGYFSIPFENNYKLILSLSNNTKYGKRGEQMIQFKFRFMDQNSNLNTSSHLFVSVSDSENVYLKEDISSVFLQSISQTNTYELSPGNVC